MEKLVYLDECSFLLNLHQLYGWASAGVRCVEEVPFVRGKNLSVVGAFSLPSPHNESGLWALWHVEGAWKAWSFELFLKEMVLPRLAAGSVLVLDNARIHKGQELRATVEAAGCSLLYLPPYSPDFNPIELLWSWLKNAVRAVAPRTDWQRIRAIRDTEKQLTPQNAAAWFHHCGLC